MNPTKPCIVVIDENEATRNEVRTRFENEGYAVLTGEPSELFSRTEERASRAEGREEERFRYVSKSKAMDSVNDWLRTLQKESMRTTSQEQESPVLIFGETGTGKEGIARMIHSSSKRARGPWISVNCSAYSTHELEKELFGHQQKRGLLDLARDGTLFLNHIEEMDSRIQARLMTAIQEGTYSQIRMIAATDQDLEESTSEAKNKEGLYRYLSKVVIEVPSLRNRSEDIVPMAEHYFGTAFRHQGKKFEGLTHDTRAVLQNYYWPGNVNELINVAERAAILWNKTGAVDVEDITNLESVIRITPTPAAKKHYEYNENYQPGISMNVSHYSETEMNYTVLKKRWSDEFEKEYLRNLLSRTQGNVTAAAKESGIDRSNFLRILRRHKISAQHYRAATEFKKAA